MATTAKLSKSGFTREMAVRLIRIKGIYNRENNLPNGFALSKDFILYMRNTYGMAIHLDVNGFYNRHTVIDEQKYLMILLRWA